MIKKHTKLIIIIFLGVILGTVYSNFELKNGPKEVTTRILVKGMACENCSEKIKRTIGAKPSVKNIDITHTNEVVKITYIPSKITVQKLRSIIESLEYKTELPAKTSRKKGKLQVLDYKLSY